MSTSTTSPPYSVGDKVDVLVSPMFSDYEGGWVPGVVLQCDQPKHARRFKVSVAIGFTKNHVFVNDRIYCESDGSGEEIRPNARTN
jgi:hypothetical protein